jgi:3-dehydroquinate dehydratase/shikimate dehydrogenase
MTTTRLCATVTAPTLAALRRARDAAAQLADLVEVRLDSVADPDAAGALEGRCGPVVVTCRPAWEGGRFTGAEEDRRRILGEALERGAEYVDIEWQAGFEDLVASGGRRVVLSMHDFNGIPRDLPERFKAMRALVSGPVKVAVAVHQLRDLLPLMRLAQGSTGESIVIGMGPAGIPSRVLASRFGSAWTYAGDGVAPGQLTIERMTREFRFGRITATTAVYGVVGLPIAHSRSPVMHNAAFAAAGLDAVYLPLEASSAEDFFEFARAIPLQGASVTAPFKESMYKNLVERDELSTRTQAVNTLRACAGGWAGMNADVPGFLEPLDCRGLRPVRAAVLGSGGAARAVVVGLAMRGTAVTVHARDLARARSVAALADGKATTEAPQAGDWDLLVNATPVGTWPDVESSPVNPGAFSPDGVVYDLVYNPERTRLLREAAAAGCATIGGLEMLVAQAARQFEWWTGTAIARDVFLTAARTGE